MSTKAPVKTVRASKPAASATATKTAPKTTKGKATPAPAPAPKRTRSPRGQGYQDHAFERKVEDPKYACRGCGQPYVHSKGFCSPCYNASRKPLKQGKTGQALVDAVRSVRKVTITPAMRAQDRRLAKASA